jgi:ABC-type transport system involved in cytochrome bd biosynthesis fused ATPase/permease subunit
VIEHGELIEQGNHRELMEQQGKYYDLFTTQSKRYVTPEAEERPRLPGRGPRH